ncbi:MAG: copper resistance protein CopC [Acidimicrobiia bacterium]
MTSVARTSTHARVHRRRVGRRLVAVAAIAATLLVIGAAPASAHASLLSVDPQPGGVYDTSPDAITLRFTEPVEVALGGIRLFDASADRVDIGAPRHPDGHGDQVQASLPKLDDGSYVVTWRVTSADSHPVEGAFTFQVGPDATASNAQGLAARLLSQQGGDTSVGVLYAIARAVLYASLALLIGGMLFLAWVFPSGRAVKRACRIVWIGWWATALVTVAGIALEGAYAAALGLSKLFDPSVWGDVLDTRYGKVALVRLALLAVAAPLLRAGLRCGRAVPRWWVAPAALVAIALAATPGVAGHASTGDYVGLALVSDTLHVLAMAAWIGGLVLLVAVVLVKPLPDGLRPAVNRFSALALGAVATLMVTGGFQAWRQVGSLNALKDTDFGRLLLAKLVVFAAMVVAAAFSREIVNRHFRDPIDEADELEPTDDAESHALVGAGAGAGAGSRVGGGDRAAFDGDVDDDLDVEPATDASEARRLRRSVWVEVIFAVAVLGITSVLVNTAPARTESTAPVNLSLHSGETFVDVTIAPGIAGRNDIHVTVLNTGAEAVTDVQMQLTRPGEDLPPFEVPLRTLGPGHEYSPLYDIPYPGRWRAIIRVTLGATNQAVVTGDFDMR